MTKSLYTNEIREYVHTRPWPVSDDGTKVQIVVYENDTPEPHLNFVFNRDNFIRFNVTEQAQIAALIAEVMNKLRKDGVPCYMGRMEHAPR